MRKALLDGYWVLKTILTKKVASKKISYGRCKDLTPVEMAFQTMKNGLLEIRPVYVRSKENTEGHVFVIVQAYGIVKILKKTRKDIEITAKEEQRVLSPLCIIEVRIKGKRGFTWYLSHQV